MPAASDTVLPAVGPVLTQGQQRLRGHPPFGGDFEPASLQRLALGLVEVARHHDGLDGTAAPGPGQSRAEQFGASRRPFPGRGDHEIVDLAGETTGVVDPRR